MNDFDLSSNIQTYWLQTRNLLHCTCFKRGVAAAFKTHWFIMLKKANFLIYRIQFNSEEQWTKALKYMLTNLKWGLAWVSSQFANKWQLGVVTSIPTFIYLLNTVKNSHLIMIKNCDTLCVCHVLIKERLCFSCIVSMILYLKKEINILIPLFSNWLTDQLHMCTVLYKP